MILFRRLLLLLLIIFTSTIILQAQDFGGTPSSVKWKQINTDTVRVIFPTGLDTLAQRVVGITEYLQRNYSSTIGNKIDKVNIVLQNDLTVSNAFVALGPYRSEYYLMPPQNAFELGAQNWADNLAIHEFRHVQQYSNFNIGLSKAMSILFGEYGRSLANAAAIPDWFFEGDAVYNETMLSEQGRGRLPWFFNPYKSLYYDNRNYNYMRLRNGSLRNYIPGHYELGYLLVAYAREKYGENIWEKITQDAAAFRPLFYPLQNALKKYTGISYDDFVKNAFAFYHEQWKKEVDKSPLQWVTSAQKNNVINYKYPNAAEDGSLIVLKNTRKDIPAFYRLDSNHRETKIAVLDIAYDDYFSYNNGKIVYASYQPDIRWGNRDYSVIKILDVNTGDEKRISSHSKYFSPDISHDSKSIAAVEMNTNTESSIVILDEAGITTKRFSNNDHLIYSYPKFSEDDQFLYVMLRNNEGEMSIEKLNLVDGSKTTVLPMENRIVGFPLVKGDTLYYSCSNNGHDEIWAYINSQNKNYRVASRNTGLYQAAPVTNGEIVLSVFTSNGYQLAKIAPEWIPVTTNDTLTGLYVTRPFDRKNSEVLASIPPTNYQVSWYPKLFRPFNFHSWVPTLNYPDYSFSIYGQNVLNTVQSQLYYTYNSNEQYHRVGYAAIYGGWYVQPVIDISQTWNRNASSASGDSSLSWNEFNTAAGLKLPLNFSGGKQYRSLSITTTYNINHVQWTGSAKESQTNYSVNYLQARIAYTGQIQQAPMQIYPHCAHSIALQYRSVVTKYTAYQFLANGTFYLPGLMKTHNLVLSAAYQLRDTAGEYSFTNNFPYARGYEAYNYPRMWKLGVNYHFPLLYPDWGFGQIVYFRRVRANLFYDYSEVKSLRYNYELPLRSYGAEIYFDTKWWNQQPLIFGIRYSRLIDAEIVGLGPNQWQIILPVTILN
jgi:hypothetical protein